MERLDFRVAFAVDQLLVIKPIFNGILACSAKVLRGFLKYCNHCMPFCTPKQQPQSFEGVAYRQLDNI